MHSLVSLSQHRAQARRSALQARRYAAARRRGAVRRRLERGVHNAPLESSRNAASGTPHHDQLSAAGALCAWERRGRSSHAQAEAVAVVVVGRLTVARRSASSLLDPEPPKSFAPTWCRTTHDDDPRWSPLRVPCAPVASHRCHPGRRSSSTGLGTRGWPPSGCRAGSGHGPVELVPARYRLSSWTAQH